MSVEIRTSVIAASAAIFAGVLTVASGIWVNWDTQKQANRRPFLEKQLALCFEVSDASARLATETDPVKWREAQAVFWRLYWGPLGIVEDQAVKNAMMALGGVVPRPGAIAPTLPMSQLESLSLQLAHAARDLVLNSWNVELPALR
ncbi:hypothetical protein [Reyranella sp.]|uniref:hypothetical protein n=1 Tax=Reyranella sp. TaxID=1929291 RepID=UPI003D14297F